MGKYSVIFDTSRNGILSFNASNDEEALEIYDKLINEDVYPDDLDDPQEQTEDSSATYYELRSAQGKLIAE